MSNEISIKAQYNELLVQLKRHIRSVQAKAARPVVLKTPAAWVSAYSGVPSILTDAPARGFSLILSVTVPFTVWVGCCAFSKRH